MHMFDNSAAAAPLAWVPFNNSAAKAGFAEIRLVALRTRPHFWAMQLRAPQAKVLASIGILVNSSALVELQANGTTIVYTSVLGGQAASEVIRTYRLDWNQTHVMASLDDVAFATVFIGTINVETVALSSGSAAVTTKEIIVKRFQL
jgi:hypothetical protein